MVFSFEKVKAMADSITLIEKFDDTEILKQLDDIEKTLKSIDEEGEKAGKAIAAGMDEAGKQTKIFNEALQKNSAQVAQQADQVSKSESNLKSWIAAQKQSIAGTEIAGRSVAEWGDKFKALFVQQEAAAGSTERVTVAQRVLNAVLKASPIALVITLVAGLLSYFTRFQTAVDKVVQVISAVNGVVTELANRLGLVGSAFVNLLQGNFSEAFDDISDSVDNLGGALVDAASDAFALEKRIQALRDAQIDASVSFARQKRVLDELKEASQDETLSYRERLKAIKEAGDLESRIGKTKVELATEARDILIDQTQREQNRLRDLVRSGAEESEIADQRRRAERERANTAVADREAVASAEIALTEALAEQEKERRKLDKESREIRKKASAERLKALEDERKALEGLVKDLERLRVEVQQAGIERDLAAVEKKYDDLVALTAKGEKTLSDIEKTRALTPEEIARRKELGDIAVQLEARRLEALINVVSEYAEKDIDIELKRIKDKADLDKRDQERLLKSIEDQRKLGDKEVDFIEAQGQTIIRQLEGNNAAEATIRQAKLDLDELIQSKRLENEIAFNRRLLEVETDPTRVAEILATLKTLEERLRGLDFGADAKEGKRKPLSIYDLLGIEDPEIRGGLDKVVGEIKDALDEITDANVEAAQRRTQARQDEVDQAETFLKEQQDLNKQGLRNDLSLAKQQLEQKKAARDQAFKDEQQARRIQLAADSVQQLSGLITASTNIFKSLSAIPFVGIPLAIGVIATMFGAFAVAKSKALSLINQDAPKLRKGKRISGASHEGGGVDHVGPDGRSYELENLEWVIGTEPSKKHDKFLGRLNRGEFKNVDLNYLVNNGVKYENQLSAPARRIVQIEQDTRSAEAGHQHSAMVAAFTQGVERIVKATQEKAEYAPWKSGYKKVTRKGNTKTVETVLPQD